jgi:hypothetical protein
VSPATEGQVGRFDTIVRKAVAAKPDPPRIAPTRALLSAKYRSTTGKSLVGMGIFVVAAGVPFAVNAVTDDPGFVWFALAMGALGLLMIVAPTLAARRAARAIRTGIRVTTEVVEMSYLLPGPGATIDAMANGFATGRRRVLHPRGVFEAKFETDATWAGQLHPGSRIDVLADPLRQRVLVDLGPVTESRDTHPES